MGNKAVRAIITGRVQGVWYRGWTVDQATALGLDGWVRNRRDGSVEALFVGPSEKVDAIIQACWAGPSAAHVVNVAVTEVSGESPTGFQQLPTA